MVQVVQGELTARIYFRFIGSSVGGTDTDAGSGIGNSEMFCGGKACRGRLDVKLVSRPPNLLWEQEIGCFA